MPSFTDWNLARLSRPETDDAIDGMPFDYVWNSDATPRVQGLPLFRPPYGRITAVDMRTGEHLWKIANGDGLSRSSTSSCRRRAPMPWTFRSQQRRCSAPPRAGMPGTRHGATCTTSRPATYRGPSSDHSALPMTYLHEGGCTLPSQSGSVETRRDRRVSATLKAKPSEDRVGE